MKIKVVESQDKEEFEKAVNKLLSEGWSISKFDTVLWQSGYYSAALHIAYLTREE